MKVIGLWLLYNSVGEFSAHTGPERRNCCLYEQPKCAITHPCRAGVNLNTRYISQREVIMADNKPKVAVFGATTVFGALLTKKLLKEGTCHSSWYIMNYYDEWHFFFCCVAAAALIIRFGSPPRISCQRCYKICQNGAPSLLTRRYCHRIIFFSQFQHYTTSPFQSV